MRLGASTTLGWAGLLIFLYLDLKKIAYIFKYLSNAASSRSNQAVHL